MNRKTIRIGAATVMAALALGVAGTTAQAATQEAPARTTTAANSSATGTITTQQAAQQIAANLLKYEGDRFNAQERNELRAIANGTSADTYGKLSAIVKILKKVKGFASAVGKTYSDFKKWYNGLPWYVKAPLVAAGVGSNLYDIWSLFH